MIGTRPQGQTGAVRGVWGVDFTDIWAHSLNTDAHVFFVQPNSVQATDLGNTGEDPQTPFATVEAALARCQDNRGDTILVGGNDAWIYGGGSAWRTPVTENVIVTVEGVHIIGVSADPLGVPWITAAAAGVCLTIHAMGVEVAGFLFDGDGASQGIALLWDGVDYYGENAHIHDCFFSADLDEGITMEFSWNNHIHDCIFQECDDYGIYCDPAEDGFAYCQIIDCEFHDCGVAIEADASGCDENRIKRCDVYNTAAEAAGVATEEGFNFGNGAHNKVIDCTFSCLLPVPANGDIDDLCTGGATDSWIKCWCTDGPIVATPT